METMSAPYQPHTTQAGTSHLHEPRPRPAAQPTRNMHTAEPQHTQQYVPASQESNVSTESGGSDSGLGAGSDGSQHTNYTDLTSPNLSQTQDTAFLKANGDDLRARTPEKQVGAGNALVSPMSIASPASTNGTKRTASGHVKNAPSVPLTPLASTLGGRRLRAESMSSTGSRAGELAANLKTRLGYAMTKVQHGWEHKTLFEVEQLAAQNTLPNRHSMSHVDYGKRPVSSGLSNGTSRLSMNGMSSLDAAVSPPSKRHSGSSASVGQVFAKQPYGYNPSPRLQPAPEIRPTNGYHFSPSVQSATYNSAMSPPRTPNNQPRRPQAIRTDTQTAEAERDALQALFQLGSPHASQLSRNQNASQASSSQASPMRAEFLPPRRVTFARSESAESSARPSSSEGSVEEQRQRASAALEGS